MLIFPAIDLKGGKCVRLRQGRADQETVFSDDPVAMGLKWQAAGAKWLHVVDLDGAFGARPRNLETIRALRQALSIPMQLGGGLRTLETLALYIDLGLDRLILGTAVLKDPDLVARACAAYPGRIAVGLDARDGFLAVEGWTETSRQTAIEVAQTLVPLKLAALIYTDILRDGVKRGVNLEATKALAQAVPLPVIASGGVSSLEDIAALLPLEPLGVIGVIIGRALYDGSLDLAAAIRLAEGGGKVNVGGGAGAGGPLTISPHAPLPTRLSRLGMWGPKAPTSQA
jgi:phosphoribosylformimino-5-aminoimidazole carboxamide ribotide isomerase